jgi:hypothetical protein
MPGERHLQLPDSGLSLQVPIWAKRGNGIGHYRYAFGMEPGLSRSIGLDGLRLPLSARSSNATQLTGS